MQTEVLVQVGHGSTGHRVIDLIARLAQQTGLNSLHVGVAYASVAGLRQLLNVLPPVTASRWLIGLDDFLTHPSVFDVLATLPAAEVRVAGETVGRCRFHPKVYSGVAATGRKSWLIAGSANLTVSGLFANAEAVIALSAENRKEVQNLTGQWIRLWDAGECPTRSLLAEYRRQFDRLRITRRLDGRTGGAVLGRDDAIIDPSVATTVWIEVGNITGFQKEQLEIKAEQALFFGLPIGGGPGRDLSVALESGEEVVIPVRYRKNAMWRFNLPGTIPEVARGLRPGGGRSPFIAVFSRKPSRILLHFCRAGSAEAKRMRRIAQQCGTLGRTTAREYGWF